MKKQTDLNKLLSVILLFLGLAYTSTFADVIYVNDDAGGSNNGANWENAFTDLQDALDLAQPADMIFVAAGTYKPSREVEESGPRHQSFQMINGVAIYGGFSGTETMLSQRDIQANETILSGDVGVAGDLSDNCYHVFFHPAATALDVTAVLDGFTITAGNANDSLGWPHNSGGGMYNEGSSPTVSNCTFSGNSAYDWGGGMANDFAADAIVTDCTFSGNDAWNGAGMSNYESIPEVTSCNFLGNTSNSSGGGIYNELSDPDITGCTFTENTGEYGGGIYNIESDPTVTNSAFYGNTADFGGGMNNEEFSNPSVTNCIFSGNTAVVYGGGMENAYDSAPFVTNCTFSGNTADFGGGMDNYESSPTITNSIFWGDAATSGGNEIYNDTSTPVIANSDIAGSGGSSSWDISFGTNLGGNIDSDPLFVSTDDLQLQEGSPCIDAGDNAAVTVGTDIKGDSRIIDGDNDGQAVVDMGANEYMYLNPNTPPVADAGDDTATPAGDDCTALVTLDGSGSYDPDDDPLTYQWYYGGEPFAEGAVNEVQLELGEHVFTLIVNDGTEDSEPSDVLVTVYDDTPLELSVTMSHPVLWPANNKMVEVWPIFELGNGCGGEVTIELIEVTCNQPSGKDIEIDDAVFLRAKRLGSDKAGRTYTLVYQATDEAGHEVIATAEVIVPHDKGKRRNKK